MHGALIDPKAQVGRNVSLGHCVRVHGNVIIGDNCSIGDFSILGHPARQRSEAPLELGANALVRSHSILYEGSRIGPYLETGHHVVIREGAEIGENLRIGNFSDVEGACRIGDFVRMHGYVHVGRGTTIGHFVWLYSLTTAMNDPLPPSALFEPARIGDMVTVCVNAQVFPGADLGAGVFVASGASARGRVPTGRVVAGPSGDVAGQARFLMHMASRTRHPWHRHFADAYPERARARIISLGEDIERASR